MCRNHTFWLSNQIFRFMTDIFRDETSLVLVDLPKDNKREPCPNIDLNAMRKLQETYDWSLSEFTVIKHYGLGCLSTSEPPSGTVSKLSRTMEAYRERMTRFWHLNYFVWLWHNNDHPLPVPPLSCHTYHCRDMNMTKYVSLEGVWWEVAHCCL